MNITIDITACGRSLMCNICKKRKELKIESCMWYSMNGLLHGPGLKAWKVTNYIA